MNLINSILVVRNVYELDVCFRIWHQRSTHEWISWFTIGARGWLAPSDGCRCWPIANGRSHVGDRHFTARITAVRGRVTAATTTSTVC